jgi:hypothetical protein
VPDRLGITPGQALDVGKDAIAALGPKLVERFLKTSVIEVFVIIREAR